MESISTILIVDDLATGRDTLESVLYNQNYNLVFAESGEDALKKAVICDLDLILLDVMMPAMDGFEVCRRLRNDPILAEVPIILITALDDQGSRLKGIEAGADDFISKPFNRIELKARVHSITRLNRYRRLVVAQEQIQQQAYLLDIAQDAIFVIDLQNKITYWNRSSELIYGWTKSEVIGKDLKEFIYKTSKEIDIPSIVIEKGSWNGEIDTIKKDGHKITLASRWTLVNSRNGLPKSIFTINTDITEKKKLEAQFLRAQRMECLGALTSGVAHDLNNVLSPIMMFIQLLKTKLPDEKNQKLLSMLENSSQRGADLVKQVLSFGRGVESQPIATQISHLISEIKTIVTATFPKNIRPKINVQKDLWTILVDTTQMHQVLMNLCVNARDAMPDGGILSISAENIYIDQSYVQSNPNAQVGSYVVTEVSDTGQGMSQEIIDKIFEPFFTTKEIGKGTGLGLVTIKSIVKTYGGFITLESKLKEGTSFKIYLPATNVKETPDAKAQLYDLFVGQGELILVVDDEISIREIIKVSLEASNYEVLTASDGTEAVVLYLQHKERISLVITDRMMPVMDGLATIRALRRINPNVKIIMASGVNSNNMLNDGNYNVDAVLAKPYTAEHLLKAVKEVIKN